MNKFSGLFRIIGIVSGLVVTLMFVIMNLNVAHLDLFFIEGDVWVILIVTGSFLAGYLTCLILARLRRNRKASKRSDSLERSIVGEI